MTVNTHHNVDFDFDATSFRWPSTETIFLGSDTSHSGSDTFSSWTASRTIISFVYYGGPGSPANGSVITFFGNFNFSEPGGVHQYLIGGGTIDSAEIRGPANQTGKLDKRGHPASREWLERKHDRRSVDVGCRRQHHFEQLRR